MIPKFMFLLSLLLLSTTSFADIRIHPYIAKGAVYDLSTSCDAMQEENREAYSEDFDSTKMNNSILLYCLDDAKKFFLEIWVEAKTPADVQHVSAYIAKHQDKLIDGNKIHFDTALGEFLTLTFTPKKLVNLEDFSTYTPIQSETYKWFFETHFAYKQFRERFANIHSSEDPLFKNLTNWTSDVFSPQYGQRFFDETLFKVNFIDILFDNTYVLETGEIYQLFRERFEYDCTENPDGGICRVKEGSKIRKNHYDFQQWIISHLTDSK